jgi:hypothetical protein
MSSAITVVERSANSKTGPVSASYAAQQTCPPTCPLKGSGCYAEGGMVGMHTRRMNASEDAATMSVEELALAEAIGIAGLTGELPLRMHVVGDATSDSAARLLGNAATYHTNKHGQPVWTYTHAWRQVERGSWQKVSILASCESTQDAKLAMNRGYGAAIVVSHHESDKSYMVDGIKHIPCPQQTGRSKDCVSCGLCWRADQLREMGSVIAFAIHGQQERKGREMLTQITGVQS